jgi:hypothetical protein
MVVIMIDHTINDLVGLLRHAKYAELVAKTERLRIETLLEAKFAKPANGEGTHKDGDLTITWKLNRTVDTDKLKEHYEELPSNAQDAFRWKAEVNLAHLRSLSANDPAAYNKVAVYITAKPAKPSIELKELNV